MNKPFISYLITCKNEGYQLQLLLEVLYKYKTDNECIILDDYTDDIDTLSVLNNIKQDESGFFKIFQHRLDNNYSVHKNFGKDLCMGKWIFQIDADEFPSLTLMENLKEIILLNENVDLFWIPRINDFIGVTEEHASSWGWRLSDYEGRKIVNWPDPQGRLLANLPHLKWERRLHEKVEGARIVSKLPHEFEYAIFHNKTIEKQVKTNLEYNKQFSVEDNKGFQLK